MTMKLRSALENLTIRGRARCFAPAPETAADLSRRKGMVSGDDIAFEFEVRHDGKIAVRILVHGYHPCLFGISGYRDDRQIVCRRSTDPRVFPAGIPHTPENILLRMSFPESCQRSDPDRLV